MLVDTVFLAHGVFGTVLFWYIDIRAGGIKAHNENKRPGNIMMLFYLRIFTFNIKTG